MSALLLRRIVVNSVLAAAFCGVYAWCYLAFLNPYFDYVGYDVYPKEATFWVASVAIAVAPIGFFRGVRAVSSAIAVFVYLLLYVPVVLTFAFASDRPLAEIATVQVTFMIAMTILFLADIIVIRNPLRNWNRLDLMPWLLGLTVGASAYLLWAYRGSLGFPSFGEDLYLMRAENSVLGASLPRRYLSSWLANFLIPLCLSYGLIARRVVYGLVGTGACVVLYVCAASKISIVTPVVYLALYGLMRRRAASLFPVMSSSIAALVVILVYTADLGENAFIMGSIILARTIGNGGQLMVAYYDFFESHVRTGFGHVNAINYFTGTYPYGDLSLGQVVGGYYWSDQMNANASFWATDGIAAIGLWGVCLASIIFAMFLAAMNSVTRTFDTTFAVLCAVAFLTQVLNASVISATWSGGGLLLLLFFALQADTGSIGRGSPLVRTSAVS